MRASLWIWAEMLPRVSFLLSPWKNLPKEVIKAQFPQTLKTRLGKTRVQSYPTLAAGSGQDKPHRGLRHCSFWPNHPWTIYSCRSTRNINSPLKRGIKSSPNKLLSSPTWIELQESWNGRWSYTDLEKKLIILSAHYFFFFLLFCTFQTNTSSFPSVWFLPDWSLPGSPHKSASWLFFLSVLSPSSPFSAFCILCCTAPLWLPQIFHFAISHSLHSPPRELLKEI